MTLLATQTIVFIPDYRFLSVRDYTMFEQPGATAALAAAHEQILACNGYEVFVVCAQDSLKIRLTVAVHDQPVRVAADGWDSEGTRFSLPFPTATLHAGDAFGNAITMPLPTEGQYMVVVQYAGRDEALDRLTGVWPEAAKLPTEETREVLDRWAGIERYQVSIFPETP